MMYKKDDEIIMLKNKTGMTYRDIANELNIHPSSVGQRINGFANWKKDERKRVITFLEQFKGE